MDDAVLVLSELLSNACRHARPLGDAESVRASWSRDEDGELTVSVTDGGGPTRPVPATPSVSARGGRGLAIIGALAQEWGVREESFDTPARTGDGEPAKGVTVWVVLAAHDPLGSGLADSLGLDLASIDGLEEIEEIRGMGGVDGMESVGGVRGIDALGGQLNGPLHGPLNGPPLDGPLDELR